MQDWEIRKKFLRLEKEDERHLKPLQPLIDAHVDELVGAFYRHLLSFPGSRKFLTNELITTRLLDAQKRYLRSLVTGPYDQAYEESRRRIGQVHARLGLTPAWYMGAYALYLSLLEPLIQAHFKQQSQEYVPTRIALTKVIFLDLQLAMEAYIKQSSEAQDYATEQLANLSRELERGLLENRQILRDTQQQLRFTEQVAELGTLAASMAHEIGTPMNVILGRAEQLMNRTEDEVMKKGLHIIIMQVERITRLMNQLLSLTRRRPAHAELTPLDLRTIITRCLEAVEERVRRHRTEVVTDVDEDLAMIHGDQDRLIQLMLNLVLNALHAMPEGGVLTVRAARDGHDHIKLAIGDTGHGISPELLPKIFEPFVTTKAPGQGTGLGLTVANGIVKEHHGSISVDSTPGKGTTFTILFPIASSG